ncbi:TPA_asm: DUF551 domain-containing protein [Salmonella enterica]|nr:DUF551 domain-containing protein [Salmonella enterica]
MATITKERIELFIKNPLENGLTRGEQMELARIALASLEAEPVAYIIQDSDARSRGEKGILRYFANISDEDINEYEITVTPLYAAPPETVSVPDAMEMDDDFDSAFEHGKAVGWNAYRAAMFQSGNFRENKNSSTNNFREIAETSTNSPLIPGEVLSAIREVARIRADFDDFDGDRRGIGDCLDEAEQELIVTINKYASQLAAEPIATNDVREQTAVPPIQADVAQAIENLKQKLVECNRYNYCADAVKNVEDACHAAMLQGSQPVSQTYKLPVNTPCQDAPAHIWLQTAGVWPEDGELSELTWCSHNQHHDDTLYVRADLVNGNSPVTPDGWISCSERMPDTKTAVLVAVEFDRKGDWRMKWATYIPGHPDANDGWIIPGASWKPSHWMRLPEPPQEVNRG